MSANDLFEQLHKEVAAKLGVEVAFTVLYCEDGVMLRLPAPGTDCLDDEQPERSNDIVAMENTFEEALENAVSQFKAAASRMRFYHRLDATPRWKN